jgi:hypothetical protein
MAGFAAGSSLLTLEWSRPLPAAARQATVRALPTHDELFLLLTDGSVFAVSGADTLRRLDIASVPDGAIAAIPPGPDRSDISALAVVAGEVFSVRDELGRELWRSPISRHRFDSLRFVSRLPDGFRLLGWEEGRPCVVSATRAASSATALDIGIVPTSSVLLAGSRHGVAELAASDGAQFCIVSLDTARRTTLKWGRPRTAPVSGGLAAGIITGLDFDRDGHLELVLLTNPRPGTPYYDTIRCLDVFTTCEQWAVPAGPDFLPGPAVAVRSLGVHVGVVGRAADSSGYVALINEAGRVTKTRRVPGCGGTSVTGMAAVGNWPLLVRRSPHAAETFAVLPPGLTGRFDETPGYNGVRFQQLIAMRLDDDTFQDVVVCRTGADQPWRVDVFTNTMGRLAADLAAAQRDLAQASSRRNENGVLRALRRVELLGARLDAGQTLTMDEQRRRIEDRRRRQRRAASFLLAVGAALALAVLALLVLRLGARRGTAPAGRQIEDKPLPVRVALAVDLVALDHNFVTKGNRAAALDRLAEIRALHGLGRDRDLSLVSTELEPYLSNAITRLVDRTPNEPVLDLLEGAARRAAGPRRFELVELTPEGFRRRDPAPGVRLVLVRNFEYPDSFRRMRLLTSPTTRNIIEHLVVDHVGYAETRAELVLDYTVSTQWNRKLRIRFLSDSRHRIDFTHQRGHLISQLADLASGLRPAVEVPGADFKPSEPDEKLWLVITDIVSVLEETRNRLAGRAHG